MGEQSIPGHERATRRLSAEVPRDLDAAAAILRSGGLVAMPTETVYGLAANALDTAAVETIFTAKKRPHWDPLIVHIADRGMLERVARSLPDAALRLMDAFWPGPLTLLLPRHVDLPPSVTSGRDLVGVRMPAHPVALGLIRAADRPLAAPSANLFGHISPTTAIHVLDDLDGRIDAVLDAGPCAIGVESTVLDPLAMVLYRQGGISAGQIEAISQTPVQIYQPDPAMAAVAPGSLPSPGVGIRHYAPRARVVLVEDEASLAEAVGRLPGRAAGVMLPAGWTAPAATTVFAWETWDDIPALARSLYTGLRALDAAGVQFIVCPVPASGAAPLIEALRDRLSKSAR